MYMAFGLSAYYTTMVTDPYMSFSEAFQMPVALLRREHVLYLRQSLKIQEHTIRTFYRFTMRENVGQAGYQRWASGIQTRHGMLTSAVVFPFALRFAVKHDIVDQPNARKLQRSPVPVFGGVVVYSGILAGGLVLQYFFRNPMLSWILFSIAVMMVIGTVDDIKGLPAVVRLLVEVLLVGGFIASTGIYIDNLHGLWGIYAMDSWLAIPISIFAGVGTINAINMIDGVDGYSSGYAMLACLCFAIAFHTAWTPGMVCLTMIVVAFLPA